MSDAAGLFVAAFPEEHKAFAARALGRGKQARGMAACGVPKGGGPAFTVGSMTECTSLTHGVWTTSAKSGGKLALLTVTTSSPPTGESLTRSP